jgi:hypothetical protein
VIVTIEYSSFSSEIGLHSLPYPSHLCHYPIIDSSKTTVASNNVITPGVDSEVWPQRHASAVPSMRGRQFLRVRTTIKQQVSLAQQREMFPQQLDTLKAMVQVA